MAKDLVINGVTYNGVEKVTMPTSDGGEARFYDDSNLATLDKIYCVEQLLEVGRVVIDDSGIHSIGEEHILDDDDNPLSNYITDRHIPIIAGENINFEVDENAKLVGINAKIPQKTSELTNDSGFIKSSEAPVQSVNNKTGAVSLSATDVGARPNTWTPSYSDVGAEKSGAVNTHNTNNTAHNDIRLLITELTTRLNALANSTDTELDQMAELVEYIKDNRELIEGVTTSKVNVSDIVNNLTTNVTNKPLSSAQGVALKALIDAITVPTKVSQLENDSKFLTSYTESDPTVPAWAKAETKPSYSKSEIGLANVDNVKQYSASNPPPYPVTSVNGKTGVVTIDVPSLSGYAKTADHYTKTESDNKYQPKGNYLTSTELSAHNTNTSAHSDIRTLISQCVKNSETIKLEGIDANGVSHFYTIYGKETNEPT